MYKKNNKEKTRRNERNNEWLNDRKLINENKK